MSMGGSLQLKPCTDQELVAVFRWFKSTQAVLYWAGPEVSYPLQIKRFKQESKFDKSHSHVLINQANQVLAFGQYYQRLDCCHLGRLVVAPNHRKQGLGQELVAQLLALGQQHLGLDHASLFVLKDNLPAMRLYQKLGFVETNYPQTIPLENCIYMVRHQKPD